MTKLLEVKDLKMHFNIGGGFLGKEKKIVKAVDGLNFHIEKGETLGLVGESGCGKSTTGKMLSNLLTPTSGEILFEGRDIAKLSKKEKRSLATDIQIIFQDPYASLNPRMTVERIVSEPLRINNIVPKEDIEKEVLRLLDCVGIPSFYRNRYPHEFSGGQRQRIGIARALALKPKLIVCDEPVSALDVSIQAQVLNLLKDLQEEFDLTYLFIAHGLNVVKHISDRVGVMYLGKMVELGEKRELYKNPNHPYSKALLSAIPIPDPKKKNDRILLTGDVPSPINPPSGCTFHTRCRFADELCKKENPEFKQLVENHFVACHKCK
ncbi:MAG: dipeptide ABC transporter ATP-binding protein [Tissierellales bacterium]|jgi:oligopeptide/dipeptide ABC transporter ATP-binding protein|nr:dipeptide ABC transporter ATP-binding protein [Tissierellales bacterium]